MNGAVMVVVALVSVIALHGAAAGIRASAGRDGLVHHRRTEGLGARRGILVVAALVSPMAIAALADASQGEVRLALYVEAARGMLLVYGPLAAVTVLAFAVARAAPWQVRAFTNSLVIGGLEFMRPAFAWAGLVLAYVFAGDLVVAAISAAAIAASLLVSRVVIRQWYSKPARMPDLVSSGKA